MKTNYLPYVLVILGRREAGGPYDLAGGDRVRIAIIYVDFEMFVLAYVALVLGMPFP